MRKDRAHSTSQVGAQAGRQPAQLGRGTSRRVTRSSPRAARKRQAPTIETLQDLAGSASARMRLDACRRAPDTYDEAPEAAMAVLLDLTRDKDRAVCSAAASACGRIAGQHFGRVAETLSAWRDSPSPGTRRAVAAAVARAADPMKLERAPRLIRLIEPLLADSDPAVRRKVAPPALGALLGAYPDATFEALIGWSTSSDPQVLRSIALAFATPSAAPLAKRALIVLRKLALDERHIVWRAAAAAMWRLGRQRPDVFRPELERWLGDETRAKVARQALKYL